MSCVRYLFSLLFVLCLGALSFWLGQQCPEGHAVGSCPLTRGLELLGRLWLKPTIHLREIREGEVAEERPTSPLLPKKLCDIFGPPTLHWGWTEACNHTIGGDETCELFMASEMFRSEQTFVQIAERDRKRRHRSGDRSVEDDSNHVSEDSSPSLSLLRLKQRLVEATVEERPLSVLVLGASTTFGSGCPSKQLRWTDALQNLSNFERSSKEGRSRGRSRGRLGSSRTSLRCKVCLKLNVTNEARPGTKLKGEWHYILSKYINQRVDLIVIDYAATARADDKADGDAVLLLYTFIRNWTRPPALLFLANWHSYLKMPSENPCDHAEELERVDAFYRSVKELKIPMLSYPDIACHLPSLNRTSRSKSGAAFYHSYVDLTAKVTPIHFGCGVHFILAHAVHLYLKKLLQDSCGAKQCTGSLEEICKGFQSVQRERLESDMEFAESDVELSEDQKCEVAPQMSFRCDAVYGCDFPALVSDNSSKWKLGGEKPWNLKPGWVANAEVAWPVQQEARAAKMYDLSARAAKLPATDIIFLLRLSVGTVFLDYLATYNNIGSVTCGIEDLKGRTIGPSFKVDGLWSRRASLAERVKISASEVPELPSKEAVQNANAVNAVLRCREEGQKFKIFGITSC